MIPQPPQSPGNVTHEHAGSSVSNVVQSVAAAAADPIIHCAFLIQLFCLGAGPAVGPVLAGLFAVPHIYVICSQPLGPACTFRIFIDTVNPLVKCCVVCGQFVTFMGPIQHGKVELSDADFCGCCSKADGGLVSFCKYILIRLAGHIRGNQLIPQIQLQNATAATFLTYVHSHMPSVVSEPACGVLWYKIEKFATDGGHQGKDYANFYNQVLKGILKDNIISTNTKL